MAFHDKPMRLSWGDSSLFVFARSGNPPDQFVKKSDQSVNHHPITFHDKPPLFVNTKMARLITARHFCIQSKDFTFIQTYQRRTARARTAPGAEPTQIKSKCKTPHTQLYGSG
jgi:hypothetical protein